ncbi:MAG: FAD-dependent oxidoreductase [Bacteroidetes bacterium HGW-Bacteroidetes-3]|jgi:NADH dehydrogenase|nr:MAG: FAD-dependent oxidoreductase [Bacteroidetes bacterium HGW-Bacteroidetes-3]
MKKKKIIIVGGGFAGIQLARNLDKTLFDVLLIDKINHHQFQPLFYQVATSQIEPSNISFPFRHIFKNEKNVQIRLAEVINIDAVNNKINTTIGDFDYDYLVIAIGCKTNFFGNNDICQHSFTLKTTYDAIKIRNHILQTFENIISAKGDERESLLNLVIVGAGPTGVELAGAFAEIKKNILPKDYPRIDFTKFTITLVEGTKNTLNNMSDQAKITSRKYLGQMGVKILDETFVTGYDGNVLKLNNGDEINAKTVIWAAGVIGNTLHGLSENSLTFGNRLKVNRINKVVSTKNIFAIGDIAYMETPKYPKGHPQLANVAVNQGKNLAKNFKRISQGKTPLDYEYKDLGAMATVGKNKAVVDLPFMTFKGYFAWLLWMFLHLMLILSTRNKLLIFINWAWVYITKDSSLRLILTQNSTVCDAKK